LKYQSKVRKLPSLKVQTTELRKQIAELEITLRVLNQYATSYILGPEFFYLIKNKPEVSRRRAPKSLHHAQWPLMRCRDRLEIQLEQLTSPKERNSRTDRTSNNRSASQIYIDYWKELTRLWVGIVPNAISLRHKHSHLRSFLRACSELIFYAATTDNALRAFTDRYIPQSRG
jgi:hypothetical protein